MQHTIQRQIITINTTDSEAAKVLQQHLVALFNEQAMIAMDEVFSSFTDESSITRIEKLELDLGHFFVDELARLNQTSTLDIFDKQFIAQLKEQLKTALNKQFAQLQYHNSTTSHAATDHALPANTDKKQTIRRQSKTASARELIVYFLQQGLLPWWNNQQQAEQLSLLMDELLAQEPERFIQQLRDLNSLSSVERLVMQFSSEHYAMLLAQLTSKAGSSVSMVINIWLSLLLANQQSLRSAAKTKARLLHFLLHYPVATESMAQLSAALYQTVWLPLQQQQTADSIDAIEKKSIQTLAKQAQQLLAENDAVYQWIKAKETAVLSQQDDDLSTIQEEMGDTKQHAVTHNQPPTQQSAKPVTQQEQTAHNEPTKNSLTPLLATKINPQAMADNTQSEWQNPEAFYYSEQAGIVLLWSFLPRYFSSLHLIKDNRFIDESCQEKAVLLLHYLASGKTETHEHMLLLHKLLCGWPLEKPLRRSIELTQQDHQQSETLLLAVIEHWQALKKTSIGGLRQSFLQREGRLTDKEHGWELFVDRHGFDILLDQLPWGIGTIHLPWMEKTVFVEW